MAGRSPSSSLRSSSLQPKRRRPPPYRRRFGISARPQDGAGERQVKANGPGPGVSTSFAVRSSAALVGGPDHAFAVGSWTSQPVPRMSINEGSHPWTSGPRSARTPRADDRSIGPASWPAAGAARPPRPDDPRRFAANRPPPAAPPPPSSPTSPGDPSACPSPDRPARRRCRPRGLIVRIPTTEEQPKNNRRALQQPSDRSGGAPPPPVVRRSGRPRRSAQPRLDDRAPQAPFPPIRQWRGHSRAHGTPGEPADADSSVICAPGCRMTANPSRGGRGASRIPS